MDDTQTNQHDDFESFPHQVNVYYDGENLQVLSTESVDDAVMHEMLTAALWALEQRMAGVSMASVVL